jgi:ribosomal protein S18 acetylase RimI-like enzyme
VAVPDPAPGVVVRRLAGDDGEGVQVAYDVNEASFTEHFGHVPTSFESFRARLTEKGDGWSEIWLAELEGETVGMLVGTRQFADDENAGYVRLLGTLPAARGRGVGKALLRTYFDVAQRAGRAAVLLHVDVANVTDALRLYESVGMRPVLTIDAWTKRSPVG